RGQPARPRQTMWSAARPDFEFSRSCLGWGNGNESAFLTAQHLQRVRSVAGIVEMENTGDSNGRERNGKLAIAIAIPGAAQGFNQHARGVVRSRRAEVRYDVIALPIRLLEPVRARAE